MHCNACANGALRCAGWLGSRVVAGESARWSLAEASHGRGWVPRCVDNVFTVVDNGGGVRGPPRSRQAVPGRGSCWGGLRFAPTPLRCSPRGRAAKLATRPVAASQMWKRAEARRPRDCAPQRPRNRPCQTPPDAPETVAVYGMKCPHATAGGCKGGSGQAVARLWGGEERRACGQRAQRASTSDSSRLFERSGRRPRSEFLDGPQARAPQRSRSEAETATVKRHGLPGPAFAEQAQAHA